MKRLIINADDLGADVARNEGIFEAIRAGVVTSATILPNGPALDHALEGIRSGGFEEVSFGVHLNLTEGRPLAEGLSCLTGPDGNFLGKAAAHRLLMKTGDVPLQTDTRKGDHSADRAASRCRNRNHAHRRPPARPRLSIGPANRCGNRERPRDPAHAHTR